MRHLPDSLKNVSHFQRVEAASIHLYDVDFFKLIPFWEAVNQLGGELPSSDTGNLHLWHGLDKGDMVDQPYLYGSQGRQDNLQEWVSQYRPDGVKGPF